MYYLCGLFSQSNKSGPSRPLMAAAYEQKEKKVMFYPMFMKGTGIKLSDVFENQEKLQKMLQEEKVICSNYKGFLNTLPIDYTENYRVWDCGIQYDRTPTTAKECKITLVKILQDIIGTEPQEWQRSQSKAQCVYQYLQDRGYIHNHKLVHPEYGTTYSGRSKSLGENIQGSNDSHKIQSIEESDNYFVHFDWIAADLRVLSILSKDPKLQESFKDSDPYEVLSKDLGITRPEGKKRIFQSLYSLDAKGLESVFPDLSSWIKQQVMQIGENGYGTSILGRKFYLEDGRTNKSIFNAKMQGSVVHAMHNTLHRVFQKYPSKMLTEVHDSLILTCQKEEISGIIKTVSEIMLHPFAGVLDEDPRFPLKVSVGKSWRKWQALKEFR